jgi:hypothetical protein
MMIICQLFYFCFCTETLFVSVFEIEPNDSLIYKAILASFSRFFNSSRASPGSPSLCGSGITADEKFKHQKNGNVNRYVYYKCTRTRDQNCTCGFINEDDLVRQLKDLIDDLEIQTVPMRDKISNEVQRFKKFEQMLLGGKTPVSVKDIDIRNYAKFILQEGSLDEKREFMRCLKSEILLSNKKILLK